MAEASDQEVPTTSDALSREEKVLAFWKEQQIFEKTLTKDAPQGDFIFFEGPPTANGRPGVHHLESRAFKDAIPRYKTMRGYRVPRRAGWDTHGLPVELEVEKQLGFTGKQDIEAYGVAAFNKKCRESVLAYVDEWAKFTERIGYWVDQTKSYYTYDAPFMESVWNIVKEVSDNGRLYKDYKVLPWCPVCGTALSSHELAQGYEDVKDLSVTAKFELVDEAGTYLLAWTTTPWTLPGNVGLAVGADIEYVKVKVGDETYVLAKELLARVMKDTAHEVVAQMKGSALVGSAYKPLYPFAKELASASEQEKFTNAYKVYAADFVTTTDGTGIVHTAVMYGQEDFELGTNVGLPKVHLVAPDGTFIKGTGFLAGKSVINSETNVDVLRDLQGKGLVFSKESYTHSYPHCWRSKNRLIYYARDSWYIRMQDLRDELLAANAQVHWEPEHIQQGRMGEWLANVKDWAISRERYWGTPLPVWQSEDGTERVVIGSMDELKARTKKSGNTYYTLRHGEAENNVLAITSTHLENQTDLHVTQKGRQQVEDAITSLSGVDLILTSPFTRTLDTARIVAEKFGLSPESVIVDDRLHEINVGEFEGRPIVEYRAFYASILERFTKAPEGGESFEDVLKRVGSLLYELETKYAGKRILIVSHGDCVWLMNYLVSGKSRAELGSVPYPDNAALSELAFVPLPHNDSYELDLHRPYIDDVVLMGDSGKELRRVKEVMDVWFDSGAMPYAQDHYPFENKEWIDGAGFPADFISEAIDQTRGWFYTLVAISVLKGRGPAYRNVICLGHLLDGEGKKMSKSKGNVVNPWEAIEEWGVDTLRYWMYSVNQPGDSKNFDEKTLKEAARVISWFDNSAKFYELFATENPTESAPQAIDLWMQARTAQTIHEVTDAMENYKLYDATRTIGKLIEDLSQWYVRRVRDRARAGDCAALSTLRDTLHATALMLAPFSPFIAEEVFALTKENSDPESVHLAAWPTSSSVVDFKRYVEMDDVRDLASKGLMLRQKAGIKVRQPLAFMTIPGTLSEEMKEILKDEVNVQNIIEEQLEITIDPNLTPDLIALGDERTFQRAVSEARKAEGFSPRDSVTIEKREDGAHAAELSSGTVRFSLTRDSSR